MPAGRPTSYRPEYVERAAEMCKMGATDTEIAREFRVNVVTLYRWKIRYPDFCRALQAGKEMSDARVERSLYERANGYTYKAEKIFCDKDGHVTRVSYQERMPPDVAAAFIWLKNRRPNDWRDRKDVQHSGELQITKIERVVVDPEKK